MLELDAIIVLSLSSIAAVDAHRIVAFPHRLSDDLYAAQLGRAWPLLHGAGLKIATPENVSPESLRCQQQQCDESREKHGGRFHAGSELIIQDFFTPAYE
jgi:hypothetical protein